MPESLPQDHLRVCGADATTICAPEVVTGSSPRVRSRPRSVRLQRGSKRIISACAEQTPASPRLLTCSRDHLRVCGADTTTQRPVLGTFGSSPRVRSRLVHRVRGLHPTGIISACAEQTSGSPRSPPRARDHLRVCGADLGMRPSESAYSGSSPRVRSRPAESIQKFTKGGIISACAEQTCCSASRSLMLRDHLRVCGADPVGMAAKDYKPGSSPRVRSRPQGIFG